MAKKVWTDEERKAFGDKMKAARERQQQGKKVNITKEEKLHLKEEEPIVQVREQEILEEQSTSDLLRQFKELKESNDLLKAAFFGQQNQAAQNNQDATNQQRQGITVSGGGRLLGEVEKYLIDPDNYPDPTPRLRKEPRLQPLAFDYNYELVYEVSVTTYETKTGINTKEPRFKITMNKIVLDDQGEQTDKRYVARSIIFHEDPQTALVLARENKIEVDKSNEKQFLDEMRYLRVKDWLFSIFWGEKPVDSNKVLSEVVIGGQLVQMFTKSSVDPSSIDFDKIETRIRT